MNTYITVAAWVELILMGISILLFPLLIGTKRDPYGYGDYLRLVFGVAALVPIFGRALGWW